MLRNSKTVARPVQSGQVAPELQTILSTYFECHSFEETEEVIERLLSAYICSDTSVKITTLDIANMAFAVSNLNTLLRKLNAVEGELLVTDFFDKFSLDFFDQILQESLQAWICPTDYSEHFECQLADTVDAFWTLNRLVRKLEATNFQFELEGGAKCA